MAEWAGACLFVLPFQQMTEAGARRFPQDTTFEGGDNNAAFQSSPIAYKRVKPRFENVSLALVANVYSEDGLFISNFDVGELFLL